MLYDIDKLNEILEKIKDKITEELTLANRGGKEEFEKVLKKYGFSDTKEDSNPYIDLRTARILILGNLNIKKKDINGLCKSLDIDPDRLDYISYDEATNYSFENLRYSTKYSDVIVGGVPHKGKDIGEYSSIITFLESNPSELPNVIRCSDSNGLDINKTQLRKSLENTRIYKELTI